MKKIIVSGALIVLAVFVVGKISSLNQGNLKAGGLPKIEITPQDYDFGTISMANGPVKKIYKVKNVGSGPLKLSNIWTSCACTSAVFRANGQTSPSFTMPGHGKANPLFWSATLAPGQTGELEAVFDPAFHGPQGTGPIARIVYLETNDPRALKAQARFAAQVTP